VAETKHLLQQFNLTSQQDFTRRPEGWYQWKALSVQLLISCCRWPFHKR